MRGSIRSVLLAVLAACAVGALTVGSASAATIEDLPAKTPLLAIYGSPSATEVAGKAFGGGWGFNFGFGKNMLFQACATCTTNPIGENLKIEIEPVAGTVIKSESKDSLIGGTLGSNKTGVNISLSFYIQFVDFQDNLLTIGAAEAKKVPSYSDTHDQQWVAEICPPASTTCKADPQFGGKLVIHDVVFDIGPGTAFQGTAWGEWINGSAGSPPCIKLETPAAGKPTLVETQGENTGTLAKAVTGKVCLVSANNDWYFVTATEKEEPEIAIANT